eukprot:TRINITY_DN17688_c1_g1_i1.p1 TRINITY_DN17688_c1_g1~~TRINITY_DN17688_c1_g1_i1.p1  ORF type:complete len:894 (+),score=112.25 TRINITY_DN17688_c1_g1_i1:127-2808(+)
MSLFHDQTCLFLATIGEMTQKLLDHHNQEVHELRTKLTALREARGTIESSDESLGNQESAKSSLDNIHRFGYSTSLKKPLLRAKVASAMQSTNTFDEVVPSSPNLRKSNNTYGKSISLEAASSRRTLICGGAEFVGDKILDDLVQTPACGRMLNARTRSVSDAAAATRATKNSSVNHAADEPPKAGILLPIVNHREARVENKSERLDPVRHGEKQASDIDGEPLPLCIGSLDTSGLGPEASNKDSASSKIEHDSPGAESRVDLFLPRNVWVVDDSLLRAVAKKNVRRQSQRIESFLSFDVSNQSASRDLRPLKESMRALHPQSLGKLWWDVMAILVLVYDLVVIPLQVFDLPPSHAALFMDIFIVIYWTGDTAVSGITGRYINGKLELRLRIVLWRYLRTWFLFDALVLIPEWVLIVFGGYDKQSPLSLVRVFKGMRFARLARFLRLLRLVKVGKVFQEIASRINSNVVLLSLKVMQMMLGITLLIHMLACAWYFIGKQSNDGWVHQNNIHTQEFGHRYLFSYQFSLARLHPSTFGANLGLKTVSERLLSIVVSICALGSGGVFISSITNTMAELQAHRRMQTRKLAVLRKYIRENQISSQLSIRAKKSVEQSIDRKLREQNAADLMAMMPLSLLTDLRREAWAPTLCNHSLFRELFMNHPKTILNLCSHAFKEIDVNQSEMIFNSGDPCTCMIFIRQGEFSYSQPMESTGNCSPPTASKGLEHGLDEVRQVSCMKEDVVPGQWLCEASLWTRWENQGDLQSIADSTVLVLQMESFVIEIQSHERALVAAVTYCRKFLQCMNRLADLTDNLPSDFAHEEPVKREWNLFGRASSLRRNGFKSGGSTDALASTHPNCQQTVANNYRSDGIAGDDGANFAIGEGRPRLPGDLLAQP